MLTLLAKTTLVLLIVRNVVAFFRDRKLFKGNIPRIYTLIQPVSVPAAFLPKTAISRRLGDFWDERKTASYYNDAPLDTMVMQPLLFGDTLLYTRHLAFFPQAFGLGSDFGKDSVAALKIMGENVISAHGEMWKRHRRITAPAFNHTTYKNVSDTTVHVYEEMVSAECWSDLSKTPLTNFNVVTHKLALFLIAIVGFGIPMTWVEPPRTHDGKLSTQAMVFDLAAYVLERGIIPRWAYWLGFSKLKQIEEAYTTFELFMNKRIAEREQELKEARRSGNQTNEEIAELIKDVLGRLVNARVSDGKLTLTNEELIGNCFIFTFAGHETTANALSATLALLALYPDEQEWVYQGIIKQLGDRKPTFSDFDSLSCVLACFLEGLRLYPAAYMMTRYAAKDTTVTLPRRDDPSVCETIFLKKKSTVVFDLIGMFYDPKNFPDPNAFKPRRWTSTVDAGFIPTDKATQADEIAGGSSISTLEGFLAFSYGPRTCLGHKFAKVEAVAFLTMLLREWKLVIELDGETRESWRERVLNPKFGMAMLFKEIPLKLVRRR